MGELEYLFLLLVVAAGVVRLADAVSVPYPIVLVLLGLGAGALPFTPDIRLEPEVVFLVFLPPLLFSAAWSSSPQELLSEARPVAGLAIGLVVLTMCAVAVVAHALVDGLGWAAAFALGAVVAPTDPVAAIATFSRLGVPERARSMVEVEAMLNDAVPLVALPLATAAVVAGTFDFGEAAGKFVLTAMGGIAVGYALGWVVRRVLSRLDDAPLGIFISLLTSYLAYVAAEEAGVSGVLAVVVSGIYLGWFQHDMLAPDTRLSAQAFWEVLLFGLNATLFVLLGAQFPVLVRELRETTDLGALIGAGLLVAATVTGVRVLWTLVPNPGLGESLRERLGIGYSGMRGAVSLAAALSIPIAVDERPTIVFLAVVVILVTLVGQGLTLPLVLRALGLSGARPWSPEEAIARLETAQAALDRIDELEGEGVRPEALERMRELYRTRFRICQAVLSGEDSRKARASEGRHRFSDLRRDLIGVERAALLDLRSEGRMRPDVLRDLTRELDLEEARLATR